MRLCVCARVTCYSSHIGSHSNVGALKVMVNKGLGLAKMDMFSESDPFVVAYTNPKCAR